MKCDTINDLIYRYDSAAAESKFVALLVKEENSYKELTYKTLFESARSLGNGLLKMGIGKGDKIGIMAENRIEWPIVYLAVTTIGAVIVPISILWEPAELETLANTGDLRLIFTSGNFLPKINAIVSRVPCLKQVVCFDRTPYLEECADMQEPAGDFPGELRYLYFPMLCQWADGLMKQGIDEYDTVEINPGDIAEILFVSTAMGVKISHRAICANVEGIFHTMGLYREVGRKLFLTFPYSHLYPTVFGILLPLAAGWTVVTAAESRTDRLLKLLKETEPNFIVTVPLVLERLYNRLSGRIRKTGKSPALFGLGNLEWLFVAGSKCPVDLIQSVEALGIPVLEGYGVSEMSPFITVSTVNQRRPGSVGIPLDNVKLKIAHPDDAGNGEILASGPNRMCGYYNFNPGGMPDHSQIVEKGGVFIDEEGWLHTGDLGRLDPQGFLYITGRLRRIIVTKGGTNIYPAEIEAKLKESPLIAEAVIVPAWNKENGEYPFAFIRPDPEAASRITGRITGTLPDNDMIAVISDELNGMSGKIAAYKIPRHFEIVTANNLKRIKCKWPFLFNDLYAGSDTAHN